MLSLTGLFFSAFIAATLLPVQSEAVLTLLLVGGDYSASSLLAVATAGNVLGALVNWMIGRFLMRYAAHPRFPFSEAQICRAERFYGRVGWVSLFASWVPLIGDPITVVAGLMREPLWRFLLVVTFAKGGRYLILAWLIGAL
jgi:membrane protein YqaA with SNARE-associated domain